MTAVTMTPPSPPRDLLGFMLILAVALHAVFILGTNFNLNEQAQTNTPSMEIILVHHSSPKAPEKADYLAQVNQQGSGTQQEKKRPKSPASTPTTLPKSGTANKVQQEAAPPKTTPAAKTVITQKKSQKQVKVPPKPSPTPVKKKITVAQLLSKRQEIARLSAEISQAQETYAKRPRRKFISAANTREYKYASYLEAWRQKVERIGNLNYPDQAKRRRLYGSLVLEVALNTDGSINAMRLRRSSGHKLLDDAAMRIVDLAAPFAPLPKGIRKETDILHITRTWQFLSNNRLFASN